MKVADILNLNESSEQEPTEAQKEFVLSWCARDLEDCRHIEEAYEDFWEAMEDNEEMMDEAEELGLADRHDDKICAMVDKIIWNEAQSMGLFDDEDGEEDDE